MDKIAALQAFVQVVDTRSFSKAADLLALPRARVTRLIQQLEADLQVKLLHRTTRSLTVTDEGEAYYEGALRLLGQMAELDGSVAAAGAAPRGRVKIELPTSVAYALVIPALPDFFARHPGIQLDVGISNRSIDLITEHVDCVVRLGPLLNDSLVARPIGRIAMRAVASPAYLARHGTPQSPQDIAARHTVVQIVSPRSGKTFQIEFKRDRMQVPVSGAHQVSVNDSQGAVLAALAGLGIVRTYAFMSEAHLAAGRLVTILPDWDLGSTPLHIAWPANRHLPRKVRVVVDWLSEQLSALPGLLGPRATAPEAADA